MGPKLVKVHSDTPAFPVTDPSQAMDNPQSTSPSSFSVSDTSAFTMENYIKAGFEQQQQQQQQQAAMGKSVPARLASPVSAVSSFSTVTGVWGGEESFISPIARIRHARNRSSAQFHPMSPVNVQPVQEEEESLTPTQHFPRIYAPKVNQVKFSPTVGSVSSEDNQSSDQEPDVELSSASDTDDNSIVIEDKSEGWERSDAPRRRPLSVGNIMADAYGRGCCTMGKEDLHEAWKCYKIALTPVSFQKRAS